MSGPAFTSWEPGVSPLSAYAAAKQLPEEHLRELGLRDDAWHGKPALAVPYRDEDGEEFAVRYRVTLNGKRPMRSAPGARTKGLVYGLERRKHAVAAGYGLVVEGESDRQTAALHGVPAFGIPGAGMYDDERAGPCFDGIETLYVVREPGPAGEAFVRAFAGSRHAERVRVLELGEHKDVSALHLAVGGDHEAFMAALEEALAQAVPLEEKGPAGEEPVPVLRTRGVDMERVRPITWAWERRIPNGYPSIIVGEEGVGKSTLVAWITARVTCGQLEGDLLGKPTNVLIIGDEDGFEPIWVPRLWAANADLTRLRTLDDGEYLDDFATAQERLGRAVEREEIGLIVFDQLLDHVAGGIAGEAVYNPKHIRQALVPLRRVAAEENIAALGLLHPTKGQPRSFRDLVAGSHQFNAVSRSSLLLGADPEGGERDRLLVRGKGNYSAAPRSLEFKIAGEVVELAGHTFEVPKVANVTEGERTIDDLLKPPAAPVREELEAELEPLLTEEPQKLADLARAVGRGPKDGSVRNALQALKERGYAVQVEKGWKRP